jgi:exocyst complex component 3
VQFGWVEAVLRSRDDFERSMMNLVKSAAADISAERGVDTVMSKVR